MKLAGKIYRLLDTSAGLAQAVPVPGQDQSPPLLDPAETVTRLVLACDQAAEICRPGQLAPQRDHPALTSGYVAGRWLPWPVIAATVPRGFSIRLAPALCQGFRSRVALIDGAFPSHLTGP